MTALARTVGLANDTIWPLDGPLTLLVGYPARFVIDPEVVYVRGGNGTSEISVDRGGDSTVIATHAQGTTLTFTPDNGASGGGGSISVTDGTTTVDPATSLVLPAGTLTDLGGGAGGVGLVITRIGPRSIAFDDPDVLTGIVVANVPADSMLIQGLPIVRTVFTASGNPTYIRLQIGIGLGASQFASAVTSYVDNSSDPYPVPTTPAQGAMSDASWISSYPGYVGTAIPVPPVVAWIQFDGGGALTAGVVDVYAIIATPAA